MHFTIGKYPNGEVMLLLVFWCTFSGVFGWRWPESRANNKRFPVWLMCLYSFLLTANGIVCSVILLGTYFFTIIVMYICIILKGHPVLHGLPQWLGPTRCPIILLPLREFTDPWTTVAGESRDFPTRHNRSLRYKGEKQRTESMTCTLVGCDFDASQSI